ncbi:MAG: HAMP domain-containing sensor histidine kinase [Candidatus Eremiobacteraeota bacterium]|nr:HAMP domain-containing sensor histidine kinase [Candidatus Eremiobacteraeota bacterium]
MQNETPVNDPFLSIVSHDLKAPVGLIITYSSMLRDSLNLSHDDHDILDEILLAAHSLQIQVNNLVNATKINRGDLLYDMKTYHLRSLIDHVLEIIQPQCRTKGIEIKNFIDENLWIKGDFEKLQEVLMNLVKNAIQASPRKSTVTVAARKEGGNAVIEVQDAGKGIEPSDLERVFLAGERGSDRKTGAGLGLYIARAIVRAHGSDINVVSEPGRGASFSFSLPLSDPEKEE